MTHHTHVGFLLLFVVWSTPCIHIALCLAIYTSRLFSPLSARIRLAVLVQQVSHRVEGNLKPALPGMVNRQYFDFRIPILCSLLDPRRMGSPQTADSLLHILQGIVCILKMSEDISTQPHSLDTPSL